ncbi:hypothetical protein D6C98_03044 [Aureobasidium pullulans]|nr:hypothetical protein D6C98_03044 [Aureobasidium pullulans]
MKPIGEQNSYKSSDPRTESHEAFYSYIQLLRVGWYIYVEVLIYNSGMVGFYIAHAFFAAARRLHKQINLLIGHGLNQNNKI